MACPTVAYAALTAFFVRGDGLVGIGEERVDDAGDGGAGDGGHPE